MCLAPWTRLPIHLAQFSYHPTHTTHFNKYLLMGTSGFLIILVLTMGRRRERKPLGEYSVKGFWDDYIREAFELKAWMLEPYLSSSMVCQIRTLKGQVLLKLRETFETLWQLPIPTIRSTPARHGDHGHPCPTASAWAHCPFSCFVFMGVNFSLKGKGVPQCLIELFALQREDWDAEQGCK